MQHIQILAYSSPCAWIFWAVFLFAFVPEFLLMARLRPAKGEKTDQGSMQLIMLVGWIAFPAAFTVASWARFVLLDGQKIWFGVGMATLLGGIAAAAVLLAASGKIFHRQREGAGGPNGDSGGHLQMGAASFLHRRDVDVLGRGAWTDELAECTDSGSDGRGDLCVPGASGGTCAGDLAGVRLSGLHAAHHPVYSFRVLIAFGSRRREGRFAQAEGANRVGCELHPC